uniref:Uncharacterized protein n=1 Tax=Amphilophus citrinellus TaxID=61819 RepID=A0A3Q0RDC7_AMPCI
MLLQRKDVLVKQSIHFHWRFAQRDACLNMPTVECLLNLQSQMTEFEASAEPLQDWLNSTEVRVQESSARLHDLPAKKQELSKLQVL